MIDRVQPRVISADSHIVETEVAWESVPRTLKERSPRYFYDDGMESWMFRAEEIGPVPIGLFASAGSSKIDIKTGQKFPIVREAFDLRARVAAMTEDGVDAEVLYPTVCMVLYGVSDKEYVRAHLRSYCEWIHAQLEREGTSGRFKAVLPLLLTDNVAAMKQDLLQIIAMKPAAVLLQSNMDVERLASDEFREFWEIANDHRLAITFHSGASKTSDGRSDRASYRSGGQEGLLNMTRSVNQVHNAQRVISDFIFSGLLERYEQIKIVSAENDAGWAAHFAYRLDHYYRKHRSWVKSGLKRLLPSEIMKRQVYLTFMDDIEAVAASADACNVMWGSDYPHSESTWPRSRQILAQLGEGLSDRRRAAIFGGNARALYFS